MKPSKILRPIPAEILALLLHDKSRLYFAIAASLFSILWAWFFWPVSRPIALRIPPPSDLKSEQFPVRLARNLSTLNQDDVLMANDYIEIRRREPLLVHGICYTIPSRVMTRSGLVQEREVGILMIERGPEILFTVGQEAMRRTIDRGPNTLCLGEANRELSNDRYDSFAASYSVKNVVEKFSERKKALLWRVVDQAGFDVGKVEGTLALPPGITPDAVESITPFIQTQVIGVPLDLPPPDPATASRLPLPKESVQIGQDSTKRTIIKFVSPTTLKGHEAILVDVIWHVNAMPA